MEQYRGWITPFYGNDAAKTLLARAMHNDRLQHAYLFYGEAGLGKKTFAKHFAMTLLCQGEEKPCGGCMSCRKLDRQVHPDVRWILPEKQGGTLGVEAIREIKRDCIVQPNESTYKVYILPSVQNMTAAAQNALLKTLEEPVRQVVFLLTADSLHQVLPTIRSRACPVPLFPLSDVILREACLAAKPELSEERLQSVISGAQGNLGRAFVLLEREEQTALQESVKRWINCITVGSEYDCLQFLHGFEKKKDEWKALLSVYADLLQEAIRCQAKGERCVGSMGSSLQDQFTLSQLMAFRELARQWQQLMDANTNYALLLSCISLQIQQIKRSIYDRSSWSTI